MRRPLVKQIWHCLQGGSGIGKELYTSRLVASVFHSPYSWRNQNINQVDVLGYRNLCSSCSSVYIMGFWRLHGCGELSLLHFGPKTSVLLTSGGFWLPQLSALGMWVNLPLAHGIAMLQPRKKPYPLTFVEGVREKMKGNGYQFGCHLIYLLWNWKTCN